MASTATDSLTRRELIERVSALLGGAALIGQTALLSGCATDPSRARAGELFAEGDVSLLDEIAETILPATDTPGAKAAGVGRFIITMVTDAYTPAEQRVFLAGLRSIDRASAAEHGVRFVDATPAQRLALVEKLDREQYEAPRDAKPPHYFRMMKELTLLGFFTSEIGCKQALRYIETPGRYDACAPYSPGDRAWAPHA